MGKNKNTHPSWGWGVSQGAGTRDVVSLGMRCSPGCASAVPARTGLWRDQKSLDMVKSRLNFSFIFPPSEMGPRWIGAAQPGR